MDGYGPEYSKLAKVAYPPGKAEVVELSRTLQLPQRIVKHGIVSRDTTGTIIGTYPPGKIGSTRTLFASFA